MESMHFLHHILLLVLCGLLALCQCSATELEVNQIAILFVNVSEALARKTPDILFGLFFEEINHAGAGGLWAELVSNRAPDCLVFVLLMDYILIGSFTSGVGITGKAT